MNPSWKTSLRRLIAMLCVAITCLSSAQIAVAAGEDIDHGLEREHLVAPMADVIHECAVVTFCDTQAHPGEASAPHHHHNYGDPTHNFVLASASFLSMVDIGAGMIRSAESSMGRGLGQSTLDRPPKA